MAAAVAGAIASTPAAGDGNAPPNSAASVGGGGIIHVIVKGGFTLSARQAQVDGWAARGSVLRLEGITAAKRDRPSWAGTYRAQQLSVVGACPTGCQVSVRARAVKAFASGCGELVFGHGHGGYHVYRLHGSGAPAASGPWPHGHDYTTIRLGGDGAQVADVDPDGIQLDPPDQCGVYVLGQGRVIVTHARR